MTSYQKRKREIAYLEQCIKELLEIIEVLVKEIKKNNPNYIMPLFGHGIKGDDFITPFTEEFRMNLF